MLQEPPPWIAVKELPELQVALPAENGVDGPPEIAAEAAFPVLLTTTAVAGEVLETDTDPKLMDGGETDRIGASTVNENTGLFAVVPLASMACACRV